MYYKSISSILKKTTKPLYKNFGFSDDRLITEWGSIIGDAMLSLCKPIKISHTQGGILHIEVYHTGIVTELQHLEPVIIEKIARYFGFKLVSKIKLHHKPLSLEQIKKKKQMPQKIIKDKPLEIDDNIQDITKNISNNELKEALSRLGTVIKNQ